MAVQRSSSQHLCHSAVLPHIKPYSALTVSSPWPLSVAARWPLLFPPSLPSVSPALHHFLYSHFLTVLILLLLLISLEDVYSFNVFLPPIFWLFYLFLQFSSWRRYLTNYGLFLRRAALQSVAVGRLNYGALAGWGSIVAAAVCEVCRQGCCGSHMTSSLHTAAFEAPELFTPVWAGRLESSRTERLRERGKGAGMERDVYNGAEQDNGEGEEMSFRL